MDISSVRQRHATPDSARRPVDTAAPNRGQDTRSSRIRPDTSAKSHTATRGLFAHIQANNAKSIALLSFFIFLIGLMQIAITCALLPEFDITLPMSKQVELLSPVYDAETGRLTKVLMPDMNFSIMFNNVVHYTSLKNPLSYIFFAVGLVYVLGGALWSSIFVKRQPLAHRVSKPQARRLYGIIEKLTLSRGLPMPAVEVIESQGCNAYASGFHPRNSAIGVTTGLLNTLNDRELEAVLAHEVAHIEGRDNRLMTIANISTGVVSEASKKYTRNWKALLITLVSMCVFWSFAKAAIFAGVVLISFSSAQLLRLAISRKREFIADARAIEIMKSPAALISALRKVSMNDHVEGLSLEVQAMMISNLSNTGLATHPSIDARIRLIEETTTVNNADIVDVQRRESPMQSSPQFVEGHTGTAGPGFGSRQMNAPTTQFETQPTYKNEKLEAVHRGLKVANKTVGIFGKGLSFLLMFGWALPFLLGLAVLVAVIVSSITGLPLSLTFVAIPAGIGHWVYAKKFAPNAPGVSSGPEQCGSA